VPDDDEPALPSSSESGLFAGFALWEDEAVSFAGSLVSESEPAELESDELVSLVAVIDSFFAVEV
jgi:hypothetical protein